MSSDNEMLQPDCNWFVSIGTQLHSSIDHVCEVEVVMGPFRGQLPIPSTLVERARRLET